uniref:Uncharacterized protein n=1 Tax=Peronospora matthiolae TaxID=2874970 RepID=A0AAV1V3S9_9STRA
MTSLASAPAAKSLAMRRNSQHGHVAMSHETRLPRELLAQIGISGKEVVKIIRARGWDIVEPHGLQQQNLYYLPGVLQKVEFGNYATRQHRDFLVGEGELYAFILREGGLGFLLPDEAPLRTAAPSAVDDRLLVTKPCDMSQQRTDQRKWKRRKKLSTARRTVATTNETMATLVDRKDVAIGLEQAMEERTKLTAEVAEVAAVEPLDEQELDPVGTRVKCQGTSKDDAAAAAATSVAASSAGSSSQDPEWMEYEKSLKARGWRAQLLQDVDVHLLRSTAAVDRRQRTRERASASRRNSAQPMHSVGPHVVEATELVQEIDALMHSIRASQEDLSSMIESIIVDGEQRTIPDRIDPVGRIGIPAFVSTGLDSLVLMRDIERYLLLFVAAVRRYQRARNSMCAGHPASGLLQSSDRAVKRKDLRALQLTIEESKRELQELAGLVAADIVKSCQDHAWNSTSEISSPGALQGSHQATLQSPSWDTLRTADVDVDLDTDRDQSSSQRNVASPRLEGGQWFV